MSLEVVGVGDLGVMCVYVVIKILGLDEFF